MNIPYVAEKVKLSHVAEIVKLSHVAGILEAGSMYDPSLGALVTSPQPSRFCCVSVMSLNSYSQLVSSGEADI